jgi:1-acyl-sn-glycerol-3-phosphate acyltransferase
MKVVRILFSIYYWIWFALVSLVFLPLITLGWLLTFWWDPRRRVNNVLNFPWSHLYILGNPLFWRTTVTGREKIDTRIPTLFVANHLSIFDIFTIFLLHRCFHWVSKGSNRWVPVLGLNMIFTRTIFFDRESTKEVIRMVKDSVKRLEAGISLIIFPEGERSPNGRIQPFLAGAFSIAKRAKVRIQPIVITGTYKILPRYQFILSPVGHITVTVLDPIPVETVASLSTEELKDLAYQRITAELPEDHLPLPDTTG